MRWLNRFGLYTKSQLTEDFLINQYAKGMENVTDTTVTKAESDNFFKDFERIDGAREFLKGTLSKDVVRYFAAKDEKERDIVRGAFARTLYFLGRIKKSKDL